MADQGPGTCFTIMPFSVREADLPKYAGDESHWDEVYAGLIVPAVERAGLRCVREDEDSQSRLITDNIWRKIESSDLILCDMSASNPNVFLELGWALRSDQRFVLIKDDLTPFYFDLQQFYTLEYSHRLQPSQLARSVDQLAGVMIKMPRSVSAMMSSSEPLPGARLMLVMRTKGKLIHDSARIAPDEDVPRRAADSREDR